MKKSLLALAALTAFAGAASAQSSVTLFGIVDVAATSISNGSAGRNRGLDQDGVNSSRIGFRGIEDLGGGLRAGFWIEGAFGPDTGCGGAGTQGSPTAVPVVSTTINQGTGGAITQPTTPGAAQTVSVTPSPQVCIGQNWQRRSTVSLIGPFGEVRLGRDYTPTFNNIAAFDPWGYNGVGHVGNIRSALGSGGTTAVRANNTIAYFLPALGGLYGQFQVAAGEGVTGTAATSTGNKEVGGRLGYAAGPVNVGAAYMKTYKTGSMLDDLITYNAGASFNAGFLTVMGSFEKEKYNGLDQKLFLVGALVPIGSGTLRGSFIKSNGTGPGVSGTGVEAKQYGISYVYDLSKRTALYTQYARINNSNGGTGQASGFRVYGAPTNGGGPTVGYVPGENSSGYQFGVRHIF